MQGTIGLENTAQFIYPKTFGLFQPIFQALKDGLIYYFSFSIWLEIFDWSELMVDV